MFQLKYFCFADAKIEQLRSCCRLTDAWKLWSLKM